MMQYKYEVPMATYYGMCLECELKKRKISQEKFAEMVNSSDRTVRRWIKDGIHSVDTWEYILRVLEVHEEDILSDGEDVLPFLLLRGTGQVVSGFFHPYRGNVKRTGHSFCCREEKRTSPVLVIRDRNAKMAL